ncbi:hypothetical protein SAMD00023378_0897 [Ralstonia sp. NT80]|nr:hypothetical protein SAMD00023378_0897 [Ralstonia sp. NT80]
MPADMPDRLSPAALTCVVYDKAFSTVPYSVTLDWAYAEPITERPITPAARMPPAIPIAVFLLVLLSGFSLMRTNWYVMCVRAL